MVLPVDSTWLDAGDGVYLGNPFSLVVDTLDGSFLVSDFFEDRVLRFGRDGRVVQSYGRPGPGPGEFSDLGPTFVLGDSVVVGTDDRRRIFQLFSRDDGSHLGDYRYSGWINGVSVTKRGVVFASLDKAKRTIAAVWHYPDSAIAYVVRCHSPTCGPALARMAVPDALRRFVPRGASSPGRTPCWRRCRG